MNTNPYESPREITAPTDEKSGRAVEIAARSLAKQHYKLTILVLAVPAVVNLFMFTYVHLTGVSVGGGRGLAGDVVSVFVFLAKTTGIGISKLADC